MNRKEMALVLLEVVLFFPNMELTDERINVWASYFPNDTMADFHTAMRACIKEPGRKFFPTPGEIQEKLDLMKAPKYPTAIEMWDKVVALAKRGDSKGANELCVGSYPMKTALMGVGFDNVRHCNVDKELPWLKKEFVTTYDNALKDMKKYAHVELSHEESKAILAKIDVKRRLS